MQWVAVFAPALLYVAVLLFAGYLLARLMRLPRLASLVLSMPLTLAVVAGGAVILQMVGWPFGLLEVSMCYAAAVLVCLLLRFLPFLSPKPTQKYRAHSVYDLGKASALTPTAGVALVLTTSVSMLLSFARLFHKMPSPNTFSQTYDNNFHLSMIFSILRTGDASSLHGNLVDRTVTAFYPMAWHDLVAIFAPRFGITQATLGLVFALIVVVWPVMFAASARLLFPEVQYAPVIAPLLGLLFPNFPLLFIEYGVLYPNLVGYMCSLGLFAVIASSARGYLRSWPGLWVVLFVAFCGANLAHANSMFVLGALLIPVVYLGVGRYLRNRAMAAWLPVSLALSTLVVAIGYLLVNLLPGMSAMRDSIHIWKIEFSLLGAIVNAFTVGDYSHVWPYVSSLGVVYILALITLIWRGRQYWWLVLIQAISIGLFVICDGMDYWWRRYFVGYFYGDPRRIEAIVAISALLAVACAAGLWISWLALRFSGSRAGASRGSKGANLGAGSGASNASQLVAVLVVSALCLVQFAFSPGLHRVYGGIKDDYSLGKDAPLLSQKEMDFIAKVNEIVPADEGIIGVPFNGSQAEWEFQGRPVMFPHIDYVYKPERYIVRDHLADLKFRRDICPLINKDKFYWLLYFPGPTIHYRSPKKDYSGVVRMYRSKQAKLVYEKDGMKLYHLNICH